MMYYYDNFFFFKQKTAYEIRLSLVGSPPVNWTANAGAARWARRRRSISTTCSNDGSNEFRLASAKQTAQDRLQRAVRSMLAREVCVECDPQMPQRFGHSFPNPSAGFANSSPSPV